ncbi:MAG TPA: (deoxy)nucleoside triphosphate pyrophosphohydrolase [Victivallales bacterium]|nr:(deoxy)nucleoside triphosphate pyrophosphohydrolase [Victivallales bacterium]
MIEVCAAVIRVKNKFLLTTRPEGSHLAGQWEFPGGKLKIDESHYECIVRELYEELSLDVVPLDKLYTLKWSYLEKTVLLHFYRTLPVYINEIKPKSNDGQFIDFVSVNNLKNYDFVEADKVFVKYLCRE